MMSIREAFVVCFDEAAAAAIEQAAAEHANEPNSTNIGSDPFRWAILIAIGYECMSRNEFRAYHGIVPPWDDLKAWIIEHSDLGEHDGDCDYLSMLGGIYDEFMPTAKPN